MDALRHVRKRTRGLVHMCTHIAAHARTAGAASSSAPLQDAATAAVARGPLVAARLRKLLKKRSQVLQGRGEQLYSERVMQLNKAIMEARAEQYQQVSGLPTT